MASAVASVLPVTPPPALPALTVLAPAATLTLAAPTDTGMPAGEPAETAIVRSPVAAKSATTTEPATGASTGGETMARASAAVRPAEPATGRCRSMPRHAVMEPVAPEDATAHVYETGPFEPATR